MTELGTDGAADTEAGNLSPEDVAFSRSVGARLRAIRHAQGLSLADVEERSSGRWSVVGRRRLRAGLPHPVAAAAARRWPTSTRCPWRVLLGEPHPASTTAGPAQARPRPRGAGRDRPGRRRSAGSSSRSSRPAVTSTARILSLRHDDLKALCTLVGGDIPTGVAQLRAWGVHDRRPRRSPGLDPLAHRPPPATRPSRGLKRLGRPGAGRYRSRPVALVVQKFGGTSVADPDRIREVGRPRRAAPRRRGDDVVVVVSAMGKETDELLRLAARGVATPGPGREMDMLITAGERKATALLCMALHDLGVDGRLVHRQPGRLHHRHQPHQRQDPRGPRRPHPRRARRRARCPWSAAPRACRPTAT